MKPLWKVKSSFNRTSWKVSDVQIVRYTWVLPVSLSLCVACCVLLWWKREGRRRLIELKCRTQARTERARAVRHETQHRTCAAISVKKRIGVRSLPFPPSTCPSVVASAPVTYAAHGAERTLPSVSLEERSSSRGPSPTSLAVSSSISSSVSSSVSPSMCYTV